MKVDLKIIAWLWHCEDDVCDCWQPVIELCTWTADGYPRWRRLWEGAFISQPTSEEFDGLKRVLTVAAKAHGIILTEHSCGARCYVEVKETP